MSGSSRKQKVTLPPCSNTPKKIQMPGQRKKSVNIISFKTWKTWQRKRWV